MKPLRVKFVSTTSPGRKVDKPQKRASRPNQQPPFNVPGRPNEQRKANSDSDDDLPPIGAQHRASGEWEERKKKESANWMARRETDWRWCSYIGGAGGGARGAAGGGTGGSSGAARHHGACACAARADRRGQQQRAAAAWRMAAAAASPAPAA